VYVPETYNTFIREQQRFKPIYKFMKTAFEYVLGKGIWAANIGNGSTPQILFFSQVLFFQSQRDGKSPLIMVIDLLTPCQKVHISP